MLLLRTIEEIVVVYHLDVGKTPTSIRENMFPSEIKWGIIVTQKALYSLASNY